MEHIPNKEEIIENESWTIQSNKSNTKTKHINRIHPSIAEINSSIIKEEYPIQNSELNFRWNNAPDVRNEIPKGIKATITNLKQPIFCNNCGKYGHFFYQCNNPITSIGIIAFRYLPLSHTFSNTSLPTLTTRKREYLIIRRKDTLGYIDFIRGKYSIHNKQYILNMFKQMTDDERQTILRYVKEEMSYDYKFKLWRQLWTSDPQTITHYGSSNNYFQCGGQPNPSHEKSGKNFKVSEEKISKDKFVILANGMHTNAYSNTNNNSNGTFEYNHEKKFTKNFQKRHPFNIQTLIEECEQKYPEWRWKEQEWGFPKGRRDSQESDFNCGLREFTEETGYYKSIPVDLLTFYASSRNITWIEKKKEPPSFSLNIGNQPFYEKMGDIHDPKLSISLKNSFNEDDSLEAKLRRSKNMIKITGVLNVFPFEENFVGSNQKPYKHKYYLMQMDYDTKQAEYQSSEVSNTAWKTYEECMELFRFYNEEKKQMLTRIHCMLEHFDLV